MQGLPDWQPQPQVDGAAAGVRQPQVQDGPGQDAQVQAAGVSVFIVDLLGDAGQGDPWREFWKTVPRES